MEKLKYHSDLCRSVEDWSSFKLNILVAPPLGTQMHGYTCKRIRIV